MTSQENSAGPVEAAGQDLLAILVGQGHLNEDQADQCRRRIRRAGVPPHQAVLDLGFTSQEAVFRALSECTGLPFMILGPRDIPDELKQKVPAKVALHYRLVPLSLERGTLTAAFCSPPSVRDRENLRLLLGMRMEPVLATPTEVNSTLKKLYGLGAEMVLQLRQERTTQRAATLMYDDTDGQDLQGAGGEDEEASIIRLVNQILIEAVHQGTTDIHIEPFKEQCRVRYRIDGMLRTIPTPPGMLDLHDAIISRMKIMAGLNIAERRLPHDGRIRVNVGEEEFDLRVSILPTRFGETMCLRILNREAIFLEMSQLGLGKGHEAILRQLVHLPHGIVLVTGPTGSGKTTTLYAALAQVRNTNPDRKIITVEDPVEYELEGTSQIQMKSDIGLTFASGLRSILRHDPDIILVGEIRDGETAEIAIRAALTGHLVLSTLHTNDSVGAVNRLVDMGIEPYLVASALVASLAQRLVRRICPHCKYEQTDISRRLHSEIAQHMDIPVEDVKAWKGKGCMECDHTGYRGRVAIYEFFLLDEEIQDMVSAHTQTSELRKAAIKRGMYTLREDGWEKVALGLTTIDEITRITSTFQISYHVEKDE
ncbi:MAG: hypothetical protein A3K19_17490 [Lentisphaerae bacterium RIFOXYB12_FULL_65_16]|nr:MAG: hypothetical protein A3K18_12465 [Lentisphaerae bacterium RIFOXYA12_64_32]OGV85594.1 MAG: hypothetical protein A3K19_17490 [Lentisphaerae bacterium RIFOXYB12_FULL_65_16]